MNDVSIATASHGKRALLRLFVVVISSVLALLIVEGVCRVFVAEKPLLRFDQDVSELKAMQLNDAASMIEEDLELFWRLTPDTNLPESSWPFFGIISNAQSLREADPIEEKKPADEIRILFLGDSCTFGYGVAHDRAFVQVVEELLQDKHQGSVECINAGVPGYTLFQGYRFLETRGVRLRPDLVVLNFGWNDYGLWDDLSDAEHHARLAATRPPMLLRGSRLCQLIWARLGASAVTEGDGKPRPRILPSEFSEILKNADALAEREEIPVLVLVWPMRNNAIPAANPDARSTLQLEMLSFGQQHPVLASPPVGGALDLVPLARDLVKEHGVDAVYFDHGHMKPVGHQAVAEAIADHLEAWVESIRAVSQGS